LALGNVRTLHGVRLEWQQDNGSAVMKEIPGSEFELDCDLVLLALGFLGPESDTIVRQLGCAGDSSGSSRAALMKPFDQDLDHGPGSTFGEDADGHLRAIDWTEQSPLVCNPFASCYAGEAVSYRAAGKRLFFLAVPMGGVAEPG
jgi:hypothetical protein